LLRPLTISLCLSFCGLLCAAQVSRPLQRSFTPGDAEQFRVELIVRSEVAGQRAEKIGARAYATPFSISSEETLKWHSTRRVLSVSKEGVAEIEETLDDFSKLEEPPANAKADEKGKTDAALRLALLEWSRAGKLILHYRENPRGEINGLAAEGGPLLDETPAAITLWLRHATRPRAVLRSARGAADAVWNETRAVQLPPWKNAGGIETGEWLAGPYPALSGVRYDNLHVTQQINATVPAVDGVVGEGQARFFADSVSSVVGAGLAIYGGQGSLVSATRSAAREITRTLPPIEGLPEPPQFRSKLSVEIRITRADWPPK